MQLGRRILGICSSYHSSWWMPCTLKQPNTHCIAYTVYIQRWQNQRITNINWFSKVFGPPQSARMASMHLGISGTVLKIWIPFFWKMMMMVVVENAVQHVALVLLNGIRLCWDLASPSNGNDKNMRNCTETITRPLDWTGDVLPHNHAALTGFHQKWYNNLLHVLKLILLNVHVTIYIK